MSFGGSREVIDSVLIVDDSAVQRQVVLALCRELGIAHIHEAGNGQEALAALDALDALASPPALLILDLEMPTMDGLELLRHLGTRNLAAPIIVASSRERALVHSVESLGAALGLRILGALQKPLTLDALTALLRSDPDEATEAKGPSGASPIDPEALRTGIERGEIVVHYHPQVELATGYVRGVEALARWQHPTRGLLMPDQFIPIAEQYGLIHPLTLHVMSQAMLQTALWIAEGLDLSVAINLSPVLLDRAELVNEISGIQESHGIAADHVVLEVTESAVLREVGVALSVLSRLRLRHFGLSLDDYGMGFSSMQQLARIPFTELKIDRSFVHGAYERESLQVILRSALDMASKLGLQTVAEGVESLSDWRLLQEYGCGFAQGWLIAKPMPSSRFEEWLKGHLARRSELLRSDSSSESRR
jgi:EAL domain-containing protein (putative c-di-GMP-specific phosphodiesterase class I)